MYNPDDDIYNEFHYICSECGYDRGILDHSQYSTRCPECGGTYETIPIKDKLKEEIR